MIETLERICALQPEYSPTNTSAMRERGLLIRRVLKGEIAEMGQCCDTPLGAWAMI